MEALAAVPPVVVSVRWGKLAVAVVVAAVVEAVVLWSLEVVPKRLVMAFMTVRVVAAVVIVKVEAVIVGTGVAAGDGGSGGEESG